MRPIPSRRRAAFTLVELLTVITIIAILVAIIVPSVMYAYRSVKVKTISMEVAALEQAIQQYKNLYGDYPPDGSSRAIFERHYRKLFPQIAQTEFTVLYAHANAANGAPQGVMDPPEALVFALGGFSKDPLHPFTGPGGPLSLIPGATSPPLYQYNVDRNNPLYEFKQAQLTLQVVGNATVSTDEAEFGLGTNDMLPVYRQPYSLQTPFVYFDSRTYSQAGSGSGPHFRNGLFFNQYTPPSLAWGVCRPYRSDEVNTNVAASAANAETYFRYQGDRSFQVIAAGLDDHFGGLAVNGPVFYAFPSGRSIDFSNWDGSTAPAVGQFTRYKDSDPAMNTQHDNSTSFSSGPLSDSLEN
jgi:prepilin-type N-terminal cleavage/methylation domain-containing protein